MSDSAQEVECAVGGCAGGVCALAVQDGPKGER
jgi:hypothetical protein